MQRNFIIVVWQSSKYASDQFCFPHLLSHLFVSNVSFLHLLKTSKNPKAFWCFQGVEKGCNGNKWVNPFWANGSLHMGFCILGQLMKITVKYWYKEGKSISAKSFKNEMSISLILIFLLKLTLLNVIYQIYYGTKTYCLF